MLTITLPQMMAIFADFDFGMYTLQPWMAAQELTTSAKGGVEIHGLLYGLVWFIALDALETKNELNTRFLSKSRSREKHLKEITPFASYRLAWKI